MPKISEFPDSGDLKSGDGIPVVRNGVDMLAKPGYLAALMQLSSGQLGSGGSTPIASGDIFNAYRNGVGIIGPTTADLVVFVNAMLYPSCSVNPTITLDDFRRGIVATTGTWNGPHLFSYQWYLDDVAISGATNNFYEPLSTDIGHNINVAVIPNGLTDKAAKSNYIIPDNNIDMYGNMNLPFYNTRYFDTIDFTFTLTPANWLDSKINDRWTYINDMYLGVGVSNGYVLGTLPIPAPAGARTWSFTGDTTGLAIDATSGEITVSDGTHFTGAATLNITVVTSDLGSYAITVTVVTSSQTTLRFIDGVSGNDSNSGNTPHEPKLSFQSSGTTALFKRGTNIVHTIRHVSSHTYRGYGDPSAAQPLVYFTPGEQSAIINQYKSGNSGPLQGDNSVIIRDIHFSGGGNSVAELYNMGTAGACSIKRCTFSDNAGTINLQAMHSSVSKDITIRHCNFSNYQGDGVYFVSSSQIEIGYCNLGCPSGTVGDAMQITGESDPTLRCGSMWVHHNIFQQDTSSNSVKGALVIQETSAFLVEDNFMFGKYFACGNGGQFGTIRNNYTYKSLLPTANSNYNNTWGVGSGTDQMSHTVHILDNTINWAARGLNLSGFSAPTGIGTAGWNRIDMVMEWNTIFNTFQNFCKITESWSGKISNNIGFKNSSNAITAVGTGASTADITQSLTLSYSSGTGKVTATAPNDHKMIGGTVVIISGATETEFNGTYTIGGITSLTQKTFTYTPGSAPGVTTASGTPLFHQYREYTTRTTTGNTFQSDKGPVLDVYPTVTGTCQDGQTVTVSTTAQTGVTYTYQWRLNGVAIGGATATTFAIPVGYAATTDRYRPSWNSLNAAELSCVVIATNTLGRKSFIFAKWPDNRTHETIAA